MKRWSVHDNSGREIYLTDERWKHITSKHWELTGHLNDVLDAVRLGKRRQEQRDPRTYKYYRRCDSLLFPFNHIFVVVAFRFQELPDGRTIPNNFIVSAWGKYLPTKGQK